jgi:beta-phosphoglucomutase family hydrolase
MRQSGKAEFAVIWDMDGVLVDTRELHYLAWSQVLTEHGISLTSEMFREVFGMSNVGTLKRLLASDTDPVTLLLVAERKEALFRESARGRVQPLPGVRFWLELLTRDGVAQAIASSGPLENIQMLVSELGISAHFAAIVSGADLPSKPDPAVFLAAAEALGISAERCVVVEDSPAGVEGAKRASMKCIAVLTTSAESALYGADVIVADLESFEPGALANIFR